jgi:hypothetical protein
MNYDQLSIEQLAALRDEVNGVLAERVAARQRELSGVLARFERMSEAVAFQGRDS